MAIELDKVLREFDFVHTDDNDRVNHVFDSQIVGPDGTLTRFTRRKDSISKPWVDSVIVMNDAQVIGSGEDPRPFIWNGSVCASVSNFDHKVGFINKIYVCDMDRWLPIFFYETRKPGKNWAPFVRDGELYFVHGFDPFHVIKLEFIHEKDGYFVVRTVAEHPIHTGRSHDKYSWLRGGSNAVQIGDAIVGFGHTNENRGKTFAEIVHRPFLYVYRPDISVDYYLLDHPFDDRFRVIDPTSLYFHDGKLLMVTSETERVWTVAPQKGRTCLYSIDITGDPDENGFGIGGRRLHRWPSEPPSKIRRLLGAWRRSPRT